MSRNYKDTLNLPKTDFPMKAGLATREPEMLRKWEEMGLYEQIQAARAEAELFILHDGPPFANGDVHMGTALNKLLKDLVVKSKTMAGFPRRSSPAGTATACRSSSRWSRKPPALEPAEIRRRCAEFRAGSSSTSSARQFRRLGVFGDWDQPVSHDESRLRGRDPARLRQAGGSGLRLQSKKPVQWSYGAQTALAEAEVEYKDKESPAVFVKFPLVTGELGRQSLDPDLDDHAVDAARQPRPSPCIRSSPTSSGGSNNDDRRVREENAGRIVRELIDAISRPKTGFAPCGDVRSEIRAASSKGSSAQHPFLDRTSNVILANFVTTETGTGAVHIAPGHGADDYVGRPAERPRGAFARG